MGSPVIGATVAVYPLHTGSTEAVARAIDAMGAAGVDLDVGPMSTLVTGTPDDVFRAVRLGYEAAAATGHVVVHVTLSNACPLASRHPRGDEADPSGR